MESASVTENVANATENGSPNAKSGKLESEQKPEPEHPEVKYLLPEQGSLMPIRAPVSEDVEEEGGGTGESGESFDSALERIAGSSTASFDTAASPRGSVVNDEQETARVMPKAVATTDDKQSGSSGSNSDNDEDVEEGENGVESVGETEEVKDGEHSPMPLAKLTTEDGEDGESQEGDEAVKSTPDDGEDSDNGEIKFDEAENGVTDEPEAPEPESARGFRVLGAEENPEERTKEPATSEGPKEKSREEPMEERKEEPNVEPKEKPREEPMEELKEEPVEEPKEKPREEPMEEPKEEPKPREEPKEEPREEPVSVHEGEKGVEDEQNESEEDTETKSVAPASDVEPVDKNASVVDAGSEESVQAEQARRKEDDGMQTTKNEASESEPEKFVPRTKEEVAEEKVSEEPSLVEDVIAHELVADGEDVHETSSEEEELVDSDGDTIQALKALAAAEEMAAVQKPSLGSAGPSLPARPTGRPVEVSRAVASGTQSPTASAHNPTASGPPASSAEPDGDSSDESPEARETGEKLHWIRVKFLRLAHRLGQSVHNTVVAQVLYRLGLAEQLRGTRGRRNAFSFDRASSTADELEASGNSELDFACTIMVLGKSGVGKSATINSLFDEVKTETSAFSYSTTKVQEIVGTVHGIKLRIIDSPGLLPAAADQRHNQKVMGQLKRFIKKSPPDIVLYFDRLDMQNRDYGDLPLLRTITDTFGVAIWFNAIVVLTHASSAPPDGPNGVPLSYDLFVAQRSHVVQQTIRQAAGDMRLMNPVSLVENHPACRTNRAGERVLPNGQVWKPQLLLLCFASKILAEANTLLKLQESTPGKPFRSKVPPLPFLLSSLLQSRTPLKHPEEAPGDDDATDDDMDEAEESDEEEEYDDLPPFRRLTRDELQQLDKKNRAAYFEELHLREKLFKKKQWKEELRRRREAKRRTASAGNEEEMQPSDAFDDEENKSAAVPVPLPDMALPPSFDSDNPTHRYRYLETASQWLVRPVLESHGWDHDNGYDGLNLERVFVLGKVPASVSGQMTKDKKDANLTMECAASLRHGEGKVSQAGFDVQTVGKDLSYTFRAESRFNNFRKNKTIAGMALTMIGETLAFGMKLEDRLMIGKRIKVVMNGGALTGKGDTAYGGTVEFTLRDKDFPIGRTLSTLGFSVMNWHGDFAVGGNVQTQFMLGRTMVVARANCNNRGAGQITIKASSSEQLQMALVGLIPLVRALVNQKLFGNSQQI